MKKQPVYNAKAEKVKDIDLNPIVFGVEPKESVVHQVAVAQMANARKNIAHTKTRGEVRGGGIKPWRQKGTGRARAGSIRSPLWVGGGVTFGPRKDRNFSQKVNKKMKHKAIFMCLSDKVNNNLLVLLDKFGLEKGKSKEVVEVLKNLKSILNLKNKKPANTEDAEKTLKTQKKTSESSVDDSESSVLAGKALDKEKNKKFDIKKYKLSLLVILPESDKKVFMAGRNLDGLKVVTANSLNVLDLLRYEKVIILEKALEKIEKIYLKR